MKAKLAILIGCLAIFISSGSFACCGGGCGDSGGCSQSDRCYYSDPIDCQCTDPGWQYNNCIGRDEYCEAFGNVGGR